MIKATGAKLLTGAKKFKAKMLEINKDNPGMTKAEVYSAAIQAMKLAGGIAMVAAGNPMGLKNIAEVGVAAYKGGKKKYGEWKANKKARTGKAQVGGAPGYFVQKANPTPAKVKINTAQVRQPVRKAGAAPAPATVKK